MVKVKLAMWDIYFFGGMRFHHIAVVLYQLCHG